MPRRPARPVSWVYSPGVIGTRASPLNFSSFSSTTVRAGMLTPSARVSVANTAFSELALEELLDDLLEGREHAGVVRGHTALEAVEPLPVAEHAEVASRGWGGMRSSTIARISSRSQRSVRRMSLRTTWRTAPSHPARLNTKKMAGSRFLDSQQPHDLGPIDPVA